MSYYKYGILERYVMRGNVTEADRKKVQALAESGEATRMIDALVKANPARAAEIAETRLEVQNQRLTALMRENPDRAKILFWKHGDELKPLEGNKAARCDKMIGLIEQDKIDNPNHTQTWEDFSEKEKKERLEAMIAKGYEEHKARTEPSKQKEDDNLGLALLAIGVIACAAGAPTLAVASFATAYMVLEYEEATKGLANCKGTVKQVSKEEFRENFINQARERGKTDMVEALTR